jgi:hypothetical protein
MKEKSATSYLDEIGGNKDKGDYDKKFDTEQVGLAHEQEVAPSENWGADKRDAVGRAAAIENKKLRLAKKLMRLSRELEALGKMEETYKSGVEEMEDDKGDDDFDYDNEKKEEKSDEDEKGGKEDPMSVEMGTDEWLDPSGKEAAKKEAIHPIEHDPNTDDPGAFRDSQMGDEEWITIGEESSGAWGHDKRDEAGRAAK